MVVGMMEIRIKGWVYECINKLKIMTFSYSQPEGLRFES
jgi:hypothetical protein